MNNMVKSHQLIADVIQILQAARQKAYAVVNSEMVQAYWLTGKRIVEEEQRGEQKAAYGQSLLKTLSVALTAELGKGFSYANLRNFRQFYLTYPDAEICYTLRSKLTSTSILNDHKHLFATKYMPFLPTEAELIAELERERTLILNPKND